MSPSWEPLKLLGSTGLTGFGRELADRIDLDRLTPTEANRIAEAHLEDAERQLSALRLVGVVVNAVVYAFLMDPAGTMPQLAYALIAFSALYAGTVALASGQHAQVSSFGTVTVTLDALFIAAWIYATGGLDSPFIVLWYASIAAVAYRFDLLRVGVTSASYVALYFGVVTLSGQLEGGAGRLILHSVYIPLTGGLVSVMANGFSREQTARLGVQAATSEHERQRIARIEEKWRSILDNAPEIVMMVDPEGRLEYLNLADTEAEQQEIQGAPVTDWLPDRVHDRFHDALERVVEDGETVTFEIESRRPGGTVGAYITRMGPITKDGEVTGASLVSTDISELRATELELETHAEELERSNRILARYAHLAAHDLQEPLRDISHYAEMLEREAGDELGKPLSDYAGFAVDGAKRLHWFVSSLRELLELDTREVNTEPVDPRPLVEEVVDVATAETERSPAAVEIEPLDAVQADPAMLRRALLEVVDNALRFGGDEPELRIGSREREGTVELWIEDEGPGIDPAYRDRVVEPFRRLHAWSDIPGTGVGLAIARRVARRNGGTLRIETGASGGTRVLLALPAASPLGSGRPLSHSPLPPAFDPVDEAET